MIKHNPENERINRKYLIILKEGKRQNEASIDAVPKALSRFYEYNKIRNFKGVHFEQAVGLPYFNPHSFRNTLAGLGEKLCRTPEDFKAWSQNLGHEKVMTTFYSHGEIQPQRQAEIIRDLRTPCVKTGFDEDNLAEALFRRMNAQHAN